MLYTIDRIEEGIAVLLERDGETVKLTLPVSVLPKGSVEGDVISLIFERDETATAAARERVTHLREKLKNRP
jgi:hypothetical protein